MKTIIRRILLVSVLISPSAYSLTIEGDDEAEINSYQAYVYAYDSSTLTVSSGASISWLYGYDDSTINISGGDISWLRLYGNSQASISYIDNLSWLLVNDDTEVHIYGSSFAYSAGHLSGIWGNGDAFSMWALEEADLYTANVSNLLPDNIILHTLSVPEPSSLAIFGAGVALLGFRGKKSSKRN